MYNGSSVPYPASMQQKVQIPNTRSELESTRARLIAACAPAEHVQYIDSLLSDADSGKAECLPEEKKQ